MALILFSACGMAELSAAPLRQTLPLSNEWRIQPAKGSTTPPNEKEWGSTPPKEINSLWYEQSFQAPAEWRGHRVVLDFIRIEGDAIIFLNGIRVAELLRPGGEVDCTAQIKLGVENVLRVFVTRDYTDISRKFEEDPLRYLSRSNKWGAIPMDQWGLGITAPVTIIARPRPVAITDTFVITSWRKKAITLQIEVEADAPQRGLALTADILDAEEKKVLTVNGAPVDVPAGRSVQQVQAGWSNPIPWELDGGYLYTVKPSLILNGNTMDEGNETKFGFREIWAEGNKLLMNGHLTRWRLTFPLFSNIHSLSFFRLLGYNASYFQANPTAWWRNWSETPIFSEELLGEMDRVGFAVNMTVPGISYIRGELLTDPRVQADYDREMKLFIRRYRNHPCITGWTVGMNAYNPRDAIAPQGMGRRYTGIAAEAAMVKVITAACDCVKRYDATRLAYSHADGNEGDLATSNTYLNFAPLQEREEWPMAWSESGNMPFQLAEFGQPFTACFWKGKRFLMTEYLAMYFGDEAYRKETDDGLHHVLKNGISNSLGFDGEMNPDEYPQYWEFQRLFVRNTNRAYRTWNVNGGWAYWNLDTQYGHPPGTDLSNKSWVFSQYDRVQSPVTKKPDWANLNFDIHRQANQPLLVYLAGFPRHTDKTHAFFAGEKVTKQIAVVWDGPGDATLSCEWSLKDDTGKRLDGGTFPIKVQCGEIKLTPFSFMAPTIFPGRANYSLILAVKQGDKEVEGDAFALQVFPLTKAVSMKAVVALFDPTGKTRSWFKELGAKYSDWKPGQSLKGVDLLLIGREALKPGSAMPYRAEDIANGLRVVIFEQKPEVWKGLGFRTIEVMPRYVFAADPSNSVLEGIQAEDLINWRGTPDLLPEGKNMPSETQHAPKWTSTHAVASVALQIPRVAGFRPVLATEFDLDYSPLLEWSYGKGAIWFCSLDLTGRVGVDPAATFLAHNLLRATVEARPSTRTVGYAGGPLGKALLDRLGVASDVSFKTDHPADTLWVLGEGDPGIPLPRLDAFVAAGGEVFVLPKKPEELKAYGLKTESKIIYRATPPSTVSPFFRAIGPGLLRWRDALGVNALVDGEPSSGAPSSVAKIMADGLLAVRPMGKGTWLFNQLEPALLDGRYPDNKEQQGSNQLSVIRLEQLVARLLTNAGATPSRLQAERLSYLDLGAEYEVLNHWNVLGPFLVDREDGEEMLNTKFPGEETAVIGDLNPNYTFTCSDGRTLNWRPTVRADDKGFVNLGTALGHDSLAVAYVTCRVNSEMAREAVLRIGADWRIQIWVNGEMVFRTLQGGNKAAAFKVNIPLKKGENAISCKVAAGSRGFGFYLDLSKPSEQGKVTMSAELRQQSFYAGRALSNEFDPYEYNYW